MLCYLKIPLECQKHCSKIFYDQTNSLSIINEKQGYTDCEIHNILISFKTWP